MSDELRLLKKKYEIALREYKKLWCEKHHSQPRIPLEWAIETEAQESLKKDGENGND